MNELTNDAKFLLSSMYAEYLNRRKEEISKEEARNFQDIDSIKNDIMTEWSEKDILDTCFELKRHSFHLALSANAFSFKEPRPKGSCFISEHIFSIRVASSISVFRSAFLALSSKSMDSRLFAIRSNIFFILSFLSNLIIRDIQKLCFNGTNQKFIEI